MSRPADISCWSIRLVDVYEAHFHDVLYRLLDEREPQQSISHKSMPSWARHCAFVNSRPYAAWYGIERDDGCGVGAVYLTHQREIGVAILKGQRGHGYALDAVSLLMRMHPGRFLWNVNPANTASIALAMKLGFGPEPIQYTFAKEP